MESVSYTEKSVADEVSEETIDSLLTGIDLMLQKKRQGAWQTFNGESKDRISQAMHTMREVLRQLLDVLAPEEEIPKAPWYKKPSKGTPVTRKMRVRYAIAGTNCEVSVSTLNLITSLADTVENTYAKLSAEAHRQDQAIDAKAEAKRAKKEKK
jgi:hypothetical protein